MFYTPNLIRKKFIRYIEFILLLIAFQKFFSVGSIIPLVSSHPILNGLLLLPFIYVIIASEIQKFFNNFFVIIRFKYRNRVFLHMIIETYLTAITFVGIYFVILLIASFFEWSINFIIYMFIYYLFILSHYVLISTLIPFLGRLLNDRKLAIIITMFVSSINSIFIYVNKMRYVMFDTYSARYLVMTSVICALISIAMLATISFKVADDPR